MGSKHLSLVGYFNYGVYLNLGHPSKQMVIIHWKKMCSICTIPWCIVVLWDVISLLLVLVAIKWTALKTDPGVPKKNGSWYDRHTNGSFKLNSNQLWSLGIWIAEWHIPVQVDRVIFLPILSGRPSPFNSLSGLTSVVPKRLGSGPWSTQTQFLSLTQRILLKNILL